MQLEAFVFDMCFEVAMPALLLHLLQTMVEDAVKALMLMSNAVEGLALWRVTCCTARGVNGYRKHPTSCAGHL